MEWQSHIDSWKRSGLSQQSYCKQAAISYGSFSKWRSQLKKTATKKSVASFVEAIPQNQDSIVSNASVSVSPSCNHKIIGPSRLFWSDLLIWARLPSSRTHSVPPLAANFLPSSLNTIKCHQLSCINRTALILTTVKIGLKQRFQPYVMRHRRLFKIHPSSF